MLHSTTEFNMTKNLLRRDLKMEKQKSEMMLSSMKHQAASDERGVRIVDNCRHFLGKNLERRVYIYCGKCKRFVHVDK